MVNIDTIVGVWSGHLLVTVGNAISISITWLSGSLAIRVVDVITIRTMIVRAGLLDIRVTTAISITTISISSQTLGASVDRAGSSVWMVSSSSITITWFSRSLAITITTISSIPITTISKRESLWGSVGVAGSIT